MAKSVDVAQLLEEQHGIIDPVEAKLQRLNVAGIQMNGGFFSREKSVVRAHRKVGFGGLGQRRKQDDPQEQERRKMLGVYQFASFNMFHLYTPRKLLLPATGLQRGEGCCKSWLRRTRRISPGDLPL